MSFHVGQKVVCVDDRPVKDYLPPRVKCNNLDMHGLKAGRIYTVRSVGILMGLPICSLAEIVRPIEPINGSEGGYAQPRFRPIVERKTDIRIFTAMLDGVKQGERA